MQKKFQVSEVVHQKFCAPEVAAQKKICEPEIARKIIKYRKLHQKKIL